MNDPLELTIRELRELATEVRNRVDLRDVRATSITASASQPADRGPLDVTTDISVAAAQVGDSIVAARSRYRLSARDAEDDGSEAWSASFELLGEYQSLTEEPLPEWDDATLSAFSILVTAMALHPFARELAQSLSGRMGFPPFTLEMLHPLAEGDPDDRVTLHSADSEPDS